MRKITQETGFVADYNRCVISVSHSWYISEKYHHTFTCMHLEGLDRKENEKRWKKDEIWLFTIKTRASQCRLAATCLSLLDVGVF